LKFRECKDCGKYFKCEWCSKYCDECREIHFKMRRVTVRVSQYKTMIPNCLSREIDKIKECKTYQEILSRLDIIITAMESSKKLIKDDMKNIDPKWKNI
jgi:ornithine cyclodeaminase/alanine dehydrogenase-like protein (mu-crystallin family)